MLTVFGRRIDRQGAFSTVITSVRVILNTGILLPMNSQHLSWLWQRMVHSQETNCCTLMNLEALDEVAHSGWAMSRQENCPHKGKSSPASPPPVATVPEEPTARTFFSEESFQLLRQLPWEKALCVQQWQNCGWAGWTGSEGYTQSGPRRSELPHKIVNDATGVYFADWGMFHIYYIMIFFSLYLLFCGIVVSTCSFISYQLSDKICLYHTTDYAYWNYCGRETSTMQQTFLISVVVGYSACCKIPCNVVCNVLYCM